MTFYIAVIAIIDQRRADAAHMKDVFVSVNMYGDKTKQHTVRVNRRCSYSVSTF